MTEIKPLVKPLSPELALEFVLVPAGEFVMGSDRKQDEHAQPDEMPAHKLLVSDYYLMRYPVTNAQYQLFIRETGYRPPLFWPQGAFPEDKANHPVVGVSYHDALAFCRWAKQKTELPLRLPTEPEWEKAARGPDGRIYPWGNTWQAGLCNIAEARLNGTSPVGHFSPAGDSPYGLADMNGNVQSWCSSLFTPYPYDPQDGRETLVYNINPPEAIDGRSLLPKFWDTGATSLPESVEASLGKSVIRGSSWRESRRRARCAYRSWAAPMHRSDDTGFRLCFEPAR